MRALRAILGRSWAITPEYLETIIQIAERQNPTPEAVEAAMGRPLDNTDSVTVRDSVATIPVHGPLFRYGGLFTRVSGASSYESLATDFTTAINDPTVRAIVLDIDSPGGEVNGCGEFAQMVAANRGAKPITAYASNLTCSAAYWIASACDEIVASPTATLGSIGVIATYEAPDDSEITFVASQSPNKRPDVTTDEGKALIQEHVDDLAAVFITAVAANRGITPDAVVSQYGQGGTCVGQKAVNCGLADRLGDYESLLAELSAPQPISDPLSRLPWTAETQTGTVAAVSTTSQESEMTEEIQTVAGEAITVASAEQYAALEARLAEIERERDEARAQALLEAEARADMEAEAERAQLGALAQGWHGDTAQHVAVLQHLPTELAAFYTETMNAHSEQIRSGDLFTAAGTSAREETSGSAHDMLTSLADAIRAKNPSLSKAQAYTQAVKERPDLYERHARGQ